MISNYVYSPDDENTISEGYLIYILPCYSNYMSQVLEQIEKQETKVKQKLTFEQINPIWSQIVHQNPTTDKIKFVINHKTYDIADTCKCVVGEFHGFSDDYDVFTNFGLNTSGCGRCTKISTRFANLMEKSPSVRARWITPWVNHVNAKHA